MLLESFVLCKTIYYQLALQTTTLTLIHIYIYGNVFFKNVFLIFLFPNTHTHYSKGFKVLLIHIYIYIYIYIYLYIDVHHKYI